MKIGLVGGSQPEWSLPLNAQRTINLFPVFSRDGKEVSALYGTPGLKVFANTVTGNVRGSFAVSNGRAFAVSGSKLYEIYSGGTFEERGTLNSSSGSLTMDDNGFRLAICDGREVYIFTFKDNSFSQPEDPPYTKAGTITYIDGYFVVNDPETGRFYISKLYDGTDWAALDYASAESSPDGLLCVKNGLGQLWLFGVLTTEIWTNTGDSVFPFQRIAGARIDVGVMAPNTVVSSDNSIFWVGQDKNGRGIVYRAEGFRPVRISTNPIEELLQNAPNPASLFAYTYQQGGRSFYVISGGSMKTSLVYDMAADLWHERAFLNRYGKYETHLSSCCMSVFGKTLVGCRRSGKIYEMSTDIYTDDGEEILRERIYTHVSDEDQRIKLRRLNIPFETGVGGQDPANANPKVSLFYSKDGARTWTTAGKASIGRVGEYRKMATFRNFGVAERITFRLKFSARVKVAIMGSYLN
jgi:hypothetical protein